MSDNRKLPVWRTVAGAYGFLFRNWREALRIGWLPFVAVVVLGFVLDYLPDGDGWPTVALKLYDLAVWTAYTPIVALAVVPWHRYILLNKKTRGGAVTVAFSAREGRYIVVAVAIMVLVTGMNLAAWISLYSSGWFSGTEMIFIAVRVTGYLSAIAASFYASAVLALALPAVAADRGSGFKDAVKLGSRNGWRLVLITLAAAAPYYTYYYGRFYLSDSVFEGGRWFAWTLTGGVLFVFEAFLAATALSHCYRALGGLRESPPGPTMIPPSGGA